MFITPLRDVRKRCFIQRASQFFSVCHAQCHKQSNRMWIIRGWTDAIIIIRRIIDVKSSSLNRSWSGGLFSPRSGRWLEVLSMIRDVKRIISSDFIFLCRLFQRSIRLFSWRFDIPTSIFISSHFCNVQTLLKVLYSEIYSVIRYWSLRSFWCLRPFVHMTIIS